MTQLRSGGTSSFRAAACCLRTSAELEVEADLRPVLDGVVAEVDLNVLRAQAAPDGSSTSFVISASCSQVGPQETMISPIR
jgi:hypothetical protein